MAKKHVVAATSEIPPGGRKLVTADGRAIVVFNLGGEFFALSNRCPHRGGSLCKGELTGLVLSDDPADAVVGELYRLRAPDAMLREFDMYEACGEGFASPTEYVRQMLKLTLADGSASEAWTYLYNWKVDGLPRIASGKFLAQ